MDDIDTAIQDLAPNRELLSSIEDGTMSRSELAKAREQSPDSDLVYALVHCVRSQRLGPLLLLLDAGVKPNDSVVEAAARSGRKEVVAALLERGWPVNCPLGGGQWPSLLW